MKNIRDKLNNYFKSKGGKTAYLASDVKDVAKDVYDTAKESVQYAIDGIKTMGYKGLAITALTLAGCGPEAKIESIPVKEPAPKYADNPVLEDSGKGYRKSMGRTLGAHHSETSKETKDVDKDASKIIYNAKRARQKKFRDTEYTPRLGENTGEETEASKKRENYDILRGQLLPEGATPEETKPTDADLPKEKKTPKKKTPKKSKRPTNPWTLGLNFTGVSPISPEESEPIDPYTITGLSLNYDFGNDLMVYGKFGAGRDIATTVDPNGAWKSLATSTVSDFGFGMGWKAYDGDTLDVFLTGGLDFITQKTEGQTDFTNGNPSMPFDFSTNHTALNLGVQMPIDFGRVKLLTGIEYLKLLNSDNADSEFRLNLGVGVDF